MIPMPYRARLLALLLAATVATGADTPTEAEWAPLAQLIESNSPEVVDQLTAFTERFPKWPDGFRALALAQLRANDDKAAYAAARKALKLDPKDAQAGALGVQALTSQGRYADALAVADMLFKDDASDPGGQVASMAAVAALMGKDSAALDTQLKKARARAGEAATPVLDLIESKQALARKDVNGAIICLERAVAARPNYRDALYELGRVRTLAAMQTPAQAEVLLAKAETALAAAAKLDNRDIASRLALGRARLERGKLISAAGRKDEADTVFRSVITPLDEALTLRADDRDGKLWKGDALLRLGRYEEAAPLLKQAYNAGILDRALPFNLALALTKTGKAAEAGKLLENVTADTADERLTLGINLFNQGNWVAANKMLRDALEMLAPDDPKEGPQRIITKRFVAHCERELAGLTNDPDARKSHLQTALNLYKEAGDEEDYVSRHWFLATSAERSPLDAFAAGRQSLKWDGIVNPTAWKLLAANYGHKIAHGEGVKGLIKYGPAHAMLWSLIAFICVGMFAKSLLMPPKAAKAAKAEAGDGAKRKPGTTTVRSPVKPPTRSPSALTRKPASAKAETAKPDLPPLGGGPKTPFGG